MLKVISKFKGLKTVIGDPKELEPGQPQDSLNWLTGSKGDHIELRMGSKLLGQTRIAGNGKITGLKVGTTPQGVQIPFYTYNRNIFYYDATTDNPIEIGSNILPIEANGEDIAIESYSNIAGTFMYVSSPHSSIYKIPTVQPAYIIDQATPTNKGYIKIKQNRMFLWNRLNATTSFWDKTGLLLSAIDKSLYSNFTTVVAEALGTGDGSTVAYSGTLAARTGIRTIFTVVVKSGGGVTGITLSNPGVGYTVGNVLTIQSGDFNATITVNSVSADMYHIITGYTISAAGTGYAVKGTLSVTGGSGQGVVLEVTSITAGETFIDNGNGLLLGSSGGTGTINYATGAYTLTYAVAPANAQAITATYGWEDATSGGVCDFSSNNYIRQDDGGGAFMNLFAIDKNIICLHQLKSWEVITAVPFTDTSNVPFRDRVNIPYWRAGDETDDGVLALFMGDDKYPKLGVLSYGQYTTTIVPTILSDDMDFTAYGIDYPVVKRWGNYDLLSVQKQTNGVNDVGNNITFLRNIISGDWDRTDIGASVFDSYNGQLLVGDSISNNLFTYFSGYDDDGQTIENYWVSDQWNCEVEGMKSATYFRVDGFIAKDQNFDIFVQYDNGTFINVGNIDGSGSYVDLTAGTIVGSDTVGVQVVGGGSVPNAYHFRLDLKVNTPRFEEVTIMIVANAVGAVQINELGFNDLRFKGTKTLPIYTQ